MTNKDKNKKKGKQGFASMDVKEARRIQSMGGKASHSGSRKSERSNASENERNEESSLR